MRAATLSFIFCFLILPSFAFAQTRAICRDIFTKNTVLKVEEGFVFEKKNKNHYLVTVIDKGYDFEAHLDKNGKLHIAAFLAFPEFGVRSHLRGSELFADMMQHFAFERINVIVGKWVDGTNYDQFFATLYLGKTNTEAAASTWTGQQAAKYGYSQVKSVSINTDKTTGLKTVFAEFIK